MMLLNDALDVQPAAIELRLLRAHYRTQWNQRQGAIADLVAILDMPDVKASDVRRAMRELSHLSPEQFETALDKSAVRALGNFGRKLLSMSVRLCAELSRSDDTRSLLELHRWQDVINRLGPRVNAGTFGLWDAVHLAVAQWGKTGKPPADLCKRAVEKFLDQETKTGAMTLGDLQLLSLIFWGVGDSKGALKVLEMAEHKACRAGSGTEDGLSYVFPSFWRNARVTYDQFLEDCQDQREMIKGKLDVQPPFFESGNAV